MTMETSSPSSELQLQDDGRRILVALYAALRAIKFYPVENDTVQKALSELHHVVTDLLQREEEMVFRVVGDFFFLNGARLRLDLKNFSIFGAVALAFRRHQVGEVEVVPGVLKEEWAAFLSLLHRDPDPDDPFQAVQDRMKGTRVRHISTQPEKDIPTPEIEDEVMDGARRTYAYSVTMARDVLSDVRIGRAVNVRKVKRAVQSIVDQVLSDEPSMLAMTHLREFDEYTFTHSVNVCIFSVVIGQRLGLDRQQLYELGIGALFHDVGKMRVPESVLNKEGALDESEWQLMQQHPTDGLLTLFQMEGFVDLPYRSMLLAYEHHMKIDLTGYPRSRRPRELGLFSRIVAVADAFDAGTSVRSYQYRPWPPDAVLREMRENPARGFDALVVKAFITATGIYPVGTLVVLDTFELAVVTKANSDPERLHQPHVKILADGMGTSLARPTQACLDETDPSTGEFRRTIIKTADPNRYGIDVADFVT